MYKVILLLITVIMGIQTLQGQDLVVTSIGDSINCKINKINTENIYFNFKQEEDVRVTMMPLQMVRLYQFNFFPGTVIPESAVVDNKDFPHWRLGITGGLSQMTGNVALEVPSEYVDDVEELQTGHHWGGEVYYYLSEFIGVGAKYVAYNGTPEEYWYSKQGHYPLTVRFYGPALSTRLMNETKKNAFFFNLALGAADYRSLNAMIGLSGNTFASMFDVGYDVSVYKGLALGMQLSYLAGSLSNFKGSSEYGNETIQLGGFRESIHRLDLSVGIKFYW